MIIERVGFEIKVKMHMQKTDELNENSDKKLNRSILRDKFNHEVIAKDSSMIFLKAASTLSPESAFCWDMNSSNSKTQDAQKSMTQHVWFMMTILKQK